MRMPDLQPSASTVIMGLGESFASALFEPRGRSSDAVCEPVSTEVDLSSYVITADVPLAASGAMRIVEMPDESTLVKTPESGLVSTSVTISE